MREPTTVTLAGQGSRTQVPRHTAYSCSRASRPGWSRAASGSVPPSRGSPVARRTAVPRAEAWIRQVGILACGESRSQIWLDLC